MPDNTNEVSNKLQTADGAVKKASDAPAVREALTGLASDDPTQRAADVARATNVLVGMGDLPQIMLVFDGDDNLRKLGMNDDIINKNDQQEMDALRSAAETGSFTDKDGNVVNLTTEEWIAARALYQNFDAIDGTGDGDGQVSVDGDINSVATDPTVGDQLGSRYADLQTAVMAFPGNPDGSENPESFNNIFGKPSVNRSEISNFISSDAFDALTPQQQRGVLALYSQYDSIAGMDGDASSVNQHDLWIAAGEAGINYGANAESMQEAQNDIDQFEQGVNPTEPLTGAQVDSMITDLEKPLPSGVSTYDYLDGLDGTVDGSVSQEQVAALANDPHFMDTCDPALASSINNLNQNWNQLAGENPSLTIVDLAAKSSKYASDTTAEAVRARAATEAAPPSDEQMDTTMRTVFGTNPGLDSSVYELLTQGQEGDPASRAGFTREDMGRTLDTYRAMYGEDSPQYQQMQAAFGQVEQDFDKYDTNHDGAISYQELSSITGETRSPSELQQAYANSESGTDTPTDPTTGNPLQPGDIVPVGTGQGVVNPDGTVNYQIGAWTETTPETPTTLADSVLTMWGLPTPHTEAQCTAVLNYLLTANPGYWDGGDVIVSGANITIPGEQPADLGL